MRIIDRLRGYFEGSDPKSWIGHALICLGIGLAVASLAWLIGVLGSVGLRLVPLGFIMGANAGVGAYWDREWRQNDTRPPWAWKFDSLGDVLVPTVTVIVASVLVWGIFA